VRVLEIRHDGPGDVAPIRAVHRAAFARDAGEPVEVGLVDALRVDAGWLPHFSLVAVVDTQIVGHVVATRASVDGVPALGVGPLGVLPTFQGCGVGTALMYALLGAALAQEEALVGLLGAPEYYGRFGFVAAAELGVRAPDTEWGPHFQALALAEPAPSGRFRYAEPFERLE
jgi:putative acetyltransferase